MSKARDIASAAPAPAGVSTTELGYVDGVTSAIQTQINTKSNIADEFSAGKNKIINGDFGVWQRGTSFTANDTFAADRWRTYFDGTGTFTTSQQTFTPGTAPALGYEGQFFQRIALNTTGTTTFYQTFTRLEDVRLLAGQTFTLSFWAKANAATTISTFIEQNFGSGGSATTGPSGTTSAATTSWQRFYYTVTMPSVAGKTIGTSSYLQFTFRSSTISAGAYFDIWGVQVEAASTASNFQTATGTKQGELAACQRYYFRQSLAAGATSGSAFGSAKSTTVATMVYSMPVIMRVAPTSGEHANVRLWDGANVFTVTSAVFSGSTDGFGTADFGVASGLTQFRPYQIIANASLAGYVAFSAEL